MSFDNIKLEKGLYTTSKGFTAALEELDPSENYIGTELEGLDAYQRQLKRFDIKVSGAGSDTVSKFFQTSDSAALFPEYVSRAVRAGIEENSVVDKIVATTTEIDSLDYRAITVDNSFDELSLDKVAEGAFIPEMVIKTKDSLTPLVKRGKMLVASYEAIKFQKLDLFTIMLKKIGDSIAYSQFLDAYKVLIGTISEDSVLSVEGLTYADLIDFWSRFAPYNLNTIIANGKHIADILKLSEFRDAAAGLNFHANGTLVTPFGAEIVRIDDTNGVDAIIGIDKNYALEKVQAGGVVTDYDKLIDRQLERASISTITGFSAMFPEAVCAMTVSD